MILSPREALLLSIATLSPGVLHASVPLQERLFPLGVMRGYQLDILRRVAALMRQGYRRILVVLPTGGGKTVLASQALLCSASQGLRGQFVVHRKELIDQTSRSFAAQGLDHSFIAANREFDPAALTTLAGVQTLANQLDIQLPPDVVVIDESHHSSAATWARVFDEYQDSWIIGLTATPERLDGMGLDRQFDAMVLGPTPSELIAQGYLSPYEYYAPSQPDMTGVRTESQAEAIMDQPDLIGDMVEHYLRLAKGQQGIVFAHSIKHSQHLLEAFKAEGVRAAHIDGTMTDKERDRVDAAFRARDVDLLLNRDLLGEGYDVPGVVYVGVGRRTQSLSWFRQMMGRGLRPIYKPGRPLDSDTQRLEAIAQGSKPAAILCDHAGNVFKHGFPDDDYEWSLKGRRERKAGAVNDDAEPVRVCAGCYRVYPSKLKACPGCGAAVTPTAREIKVREGELKKLEKEALTRKRKAEEKECSTYAQFYDLAVKRGYESPDGWAKMRVKIRSQYAARFRRG